MGGRVLIQIAPQVRILVAVEAVHVGAGKLHGLTQPLLVGRQLAAQPDLFRLGGGDANRQERYSFISPPYP
jgi:hypothetical protein